jgi:hypothetical protein
MDICLGVGLAKCGKYTKSKSRQKNHIYLIFTIDEMRLFVSAVHPATEVPQVRQSRLNLLKIAKIFSFLFRQNVFILRDFPLKT